jgi:hypothetical protein
MQERPDKPALLEAVAHFLVADLHPALEDKRLAFRVLIAANLAATIAGELRFQDSLSLSELSRLRKLYPEAVPEDPPSMTTAGRLAALRDLNARLVRDVRERNLSAGQMAIARAYTRRTLEETLTVLNPRFDTTRQID